MECKTLTGLNDNLPVISIGEKVLCPALNQPKVTVVSVATPLVEVGLQ